MAIARSEIVGAAPAAPCLKAPVCYGAPIWQDAGMDNHSAPPADPQRAPDVDFLAEARSNVVESLFHGNADTLVFDVDVLAAAQAKRP